MAKLKKSAAKPIAILTLNGIEDMSYDEIRALQIWLMGILYEVGQEPSAYAKQFRARYHRPKKSAKSRK